MTQPSGLLVGVFGPDGARRSLATASAPVRVTFTAAGAANGVGVALAEAVSALIGCVALAVEDPVTAPTASAADVWLVGTLILGASSAGATDGICGPTTGANRGIALRLAESALCVPATTVFGVPAVDLPRLNCSAGSTWPAGVAPVCACACSGSAGGTIPATAAGVEERCPCAASFLPRIGPELLITTVAEFTPPNVSLSREPAAANGADDNPAALDCDVVAPLVFACVVEVDSVLVLVFDVASELLAIPLRAGLLLVVPFAPVASELLSLDEPSDSFGLAHATPGLLATATPIPKANARPPTRPMYRANRVVRNGMVASRL